MKQKLKNFWEKLKKNKILFYSLIGLGVALILYLLFFRKKAEDETAYSEDYSVYTPTTANNYGGLGGYTATDNTDTILSSVQEQNKKMQENFLNAFQQYTDLAQQQYQQVLEQQSSQSEYILGQMQKYADSQTENIRDTVQRATSNISSIREKEDKQKKSVSSQLARLSSAIYKQKNNYNQATTSQGRANAHATAEALRQQALELARTNNLDIVERPYSDMDGSYTEYQIGGYSF